MLGIILIDYTIIVSDCSGITASTIGVTSVVKAMLDLLIDLSTFALVPVMSFIMIGNIEVVSYASYVSASTVGIAGVLKAMLDLLIDLSALTLIPVMSFIMIGNIEVVSDASYVATSTVCVAVTVEGMLDLLIDLSALTLIPVMGFIMIGNIEVMGYGSYVSASVTIGIAIITVSVLGGGFNSLSAAITYYRTGGSRAVITSGAENELICIRGSNELTGFALYGSVAAAEGDAVSNGKLYVLAVVLTELNGILFTVAVYKNYVRKA